jgi:hypothetical protein
MAKEEWEENAESGGEIAMPAASAALAANHPRSRTRAKTTGRTPRGFVVDRNDFIK